MLGDVAVAVLLHGVIVAMRNVKHAFVGVEEDALGPVGLGPFPDLVGTGGLGAADQA